MKVLLLSDVPPTPAYPGGQVMSAMVRFLPEGTVCCFCPINPTIIAGMSEEFAGIPARFVPKPNENWAWLPGGAARLLSAPLIFAAEALIEFTAVPALVRQAVEFGRAQKVDRVWATLQGQTMIRISAMVARELGVPLYSHVWDPFSWWSRATRLDPLTAKRVQRQFDRTIAFSRRVATASEPMARLYRERLGADALAVISSLDAALARCGEARDPASPLLIGFAGQFYASEEWTRLLRALRSADWRVGDRRCHLVVMSGQKPPALAVAEDHHVSFLGWKSVEDALDLLSACDVLFCPYPFDAGMREVAEQSFPSKLVMYLAAGRPILFHGPPSSAPSDYVRRNGCGETATEATASALFNSLERLIEDPVAYAAACRSAHEAFTRDFTLEVMQQKTAEFLEVETVASSSKRHRWQAGTDLPVLGLTSRQKRSSSAMVVVRIGHRLRATRRRIVQGIARRVGFRSLYAQLQAQQAANEALQQRQALLEDDNDILSAEIAGTPHPVFEPLASRHCWTADRPLFVDAGSGKLVATSRRHGRFLTTQLPVRVGEQDTILRHALVGRSDCIVMVGPDTGSLRADAERAAQLIGVPFEIETREGS